MRRAILLLLLALPFSARPAAALTLREVLELSKAGLSDDVVIALIEVEKSVFAIDHQTIKMLKAEGLSERVMIAMIKSGRTEPPAPVVAAVAAPVAAPPPHVVVIQHVVEREPRVREVAVPVAVPVYVPVQRQRREHRAIEQSPSHEQPNLPIHLQPARPSKAKPVYWGWGGKLRPDAWKPGK